MAKDSRFLAQDIFYLERVQVYFLPLPSLVLPSFNFVKLLTPLSHFTLALAVILDLIQSLSDTYALIYFYIKYVWMFFHWHHSDSMTSSSLCIFCTNVLCSHHSDCLHHIHSYKIFLQCYFYDITCLITSYIVISNDS